TKLKELNRKYKIISPCFPPPAYVATTLIATQMAENPTGMNDPACQVSFLCSILLSSNSIRSIVCSTMRALDPGGPAHRFPAKRPTKVRSTLTDCAVYYEVHVDGHEKLNFKALRMGRAGIDIYGARCDGSEFVLRMSVVPNVHCAATVGHFSLDLAESTSFIPVQITADGGTETQYMSPIQEQLHAQFAPNLLTEDAPAAVALKSSDNIPTEALWSYLLKFTGHNLKAVVLLGKTNNYMNITLDLHIDLFHWLWSKIVQQAVDLFVKYWNTYKTQKQCSKALPSGVSLQTVFENPADFALMHAGIPVDYEIIGQIRNTLPRSCEECLRWVSTDFEACASAAYVGEPALSISKGG
ncbi:hypothetical protein DFH08DRAFT_681566, partial [Mycena albidolilacea]